MKRFHVLNYNYWFPTPPENIKSQLYGKTSNWSAVIFSFWPFKKLPNNLLHATAYRRVFIFIISFVFHFLSFIFALPWPRVNKALGVVYSRFAAYFR